MAFNSSYAAAASLRSAVVEHLRLTAQSLPRIRSLYANASIPALVLAYDLYEDTDRESDLIDRNTLKNPLFIPINDPLEVASE